MQHAIVAMASLINSFSFCIRPQIATNTDVSLADLSLELSACTAVGVGLHQLLPLSGKHVSSGMGTSLATAWFAVLSFCLQRQCDHDAHFSGIELFSLINTAALQFQCTSDASTSYMCA